jgi:hypothetical protein
MDDCIITKQQPVTPLAAGEDYHEGCLIAEDKLIHVV